MNCNYFRSVFHRYFLNNSGIPSLVKNPMLLSAFAKRKQYKRRMMLIVLLLLFICSITVGCGTNQAGENIAKLSFEHKKTVYLTVGEKEIGFVKVKLNASENDVDSQDLEFISQNPKIATFNYNETFLDTTVYYTIEGLSIGETTVYVQSKGGKVSSEKITVVVKKTETQTAPAAENNHGSTVSNTTATALTPHEDAMNGESYVLSISTKKVHKSDCSFARRISDKNKSYCKSLAEAYSQGYSPCKTCLS